MRDKSYYKAEPVDVSSERPGPVLIASQVSNIMPVHF